MSLSALDSIHAVLERHRFAHATELELQDGIAAVLSKAGINFAREHELAPGDRIDFLLGDVGLECKIGGSLADVTRQLHRYAQSPSVGALMLVTTRFRHRNVPAGFAGKPIVVLHVGRHDL